MLLLGCGLHHARVGQNDGGILVTARHPVDHDTVKHAGLHVFLLHVDVTARNTVVESALGNLQFRTLLFHRQEQLVERLIGLRSDDILKIKGDECHQDGNDNQWAEGLHQ